MYFTAEVEFYPLEAMEGGTPVISIYYLRKLDKKILL